MSLMSGNATRDRIIAARDQFRAGLPQDNQGAQQVNAVPPAQPQPTQPQVQPQAQTVPPAQPTQPQQVQAVPPSDMPVPEDFIKSVDNLFGTPAEPVKAEPSEDFKAMQAENAKLMKELEELRKTHESDAASLQELNKLRDKQRVDEYLAGIEGLNTINGEDARKLVSPLLQQMDSVRKEGEKQLQETRAAFDKRLSEFDKKNTQSKTNHMYTKILNAHPDLPQLQRTQAYQDVMTSPVQAGSAITVGQLVAAELKNGNTDYIIRVLDAVKQRNNVPDIANVASVGSSAVAGAAPAASADGKILTPDEIAHYRYLVQSKQMSRDEFRQVMAKHREASKASH